MSQLNHDSSPRVVAPVCDSAEEEVFVFPLSFAQQRLWFLHLLDPQTAAYNMPFALRLSGQLDIPALERTLNEIVRRHEVLRTTFDALDGDPVQLIAATRELELPLTDLSDLPPQEREAETRRLALQNALQPFDFARGPLLRASLLRLAEEEHVLSVTMHHIVSDGWSMGVLVHEVAALYTAFSTGRPSPLPELSIQYADYAQWQREWLTGEVLAEQLNYWKQKLDGAPAVLELPGDRPRPAVQSFKGETEVFTITKDLSHALNHLCQREGVTMFMLLLAGFQTLLYRYTGQQDIVVGSPVANRNQTATEQLIGFFINTLVLRTQLSPDWSFRELLAHVRETCVGALAHQELPFEKLVEELRPERSRSHSPLFQVMFASQNTPEEDLELPRLRVSPLNLGVTSALFDLTLNILETDEQTYGSLQYNTDLFDAETIRRMCGNFVTLLEHVVAHPDHALSQLPLLTETERQRLVFEWNQTDRDYASGKCLHQLFEAQVERSPDAPAVSDNEKTLTYSELNVRANRLAHQLRDSGVVPDTRVVLLAERSTEMIVGILGILKAGAAFVPVDPQQPFERLSFMLADVQSPVVVTQEHLLEKLPADPAIVVQLDGDGAERSLYSDENPSLNVTPENAAYVIYTSGSTGQPKGVLVEHRQLCNTMFAAQEAFEFQAADVMSCIAPFAFDIFYFELLTPLLAGAQCRLVTNPELLDVDLTVRVLEKVTCIQAVPAAMKQILNSLKTDREPRRFESVRQIFIGGEAVAPDLLREMQRAFPSARINVLYGPTEATIICSQFQVTNAETLRHQMVGKPLGNMRLHVLDAHGNLVPIGVAGEIHIGGASVARGYLNHPELTAQKFITDSFSNESGARLYKSGDLGRYLADGNIEFLRRSDEQIKVRGFRIEPGEIETVLGSHPAVRERIVIVREDTPGDQRLVAYLVVEQGTTLAAGELRGYLKERLPEFMVPSAFVLLDSLPLTPNGKIDRRALPAPDSERPELQAAFIEPRTATEERVSELFAEVLNVKEVGIYDNFFDLGGHSLLATQVISRVREAFQVEVPFYTLFEAPTVEELAENIDTQLRAGNTLKPSRPERVARTGPLPLSYAQQRLWFIHQLDPDSAAYNIPLAVRLTGDLDVDALQATLAEVVRRHEALRTTFAVHHDQPRQVIHPPAPLDLPITNLTSLTPVDREREAERLAIEEARLPFDLAGGPLLRLRLLRLSEDEHVLLVTMHHIVSDGWSMGVLVREVGLLYPSMCAAAESPLAELAIQYADFAVWQREWLQGEVLEQQLGYWRKQLAGAPAVLELPSDRVRPAVQSFRGSHQPFVISERLTAGLKELSRREDATLFMTLLAAFKALLYRYTGQADIVVGSPIAGRNFIETEELIGFFINTLVLRTDLSGDPTFRELLGRVREVALGAYLHQDVPFEKLVEELQPERHTSHSPLYQVMFELQNAPLGGLELPGVSLELMAADNATAKFDLTLNLQERDEVIDGSLGYSSDLFEAETIERMVSHFLTLLEDALDHPKRRVSELEIMSVAERDQLARGLNDTETGYPQDLLVHELFEQQVERRPESIAIVCEGEEITYAELNRSADETAHRLQRAGVGPETLVGVALERSVEMVVALLGILKAGGAFVSFDLTYPKERLAFLLADTGVRLLIARPHLLEKLPPFAGEIMFPQEDGGDYYSVQAVNHRGTENTEKVGPGQLAYVFYTSGSTGQPKGVLTSHRGVVNYLTFNTNAYQLSEADTVLQLASLSFDASVRDILNPLVAGARLVLVNDTDARDPEVLLSTMSEQRVTCLLSVVPSLLHALTEAAARRAQALHETAPEVRSEGSQGQVRSAAEHAAPGNQPNEDQPGTGDRHVVATVSVGPPGLVQSSLAIQRQRADALAPGYLRPAPPALSSTDYHSEPPARNPAPGDLHSEPPARLSENPSAHAPEQPPENSRVHVPGHLRLILTSGENLLLSECAKARAVFGEELTIVNQYGATECTMSQSLYVVPRGETVVPRVDTVVPRVETESGTALAGKPIANAQLYILDKRLRLVPVGVSGEVYIGCVGVARGYLHEPAQTAERFIPHPFSSEPGARLYRTGDLARYRSSGDLELLGRIDHQVKLRGLRIELAEIEAALNLHDDVREAVVLAREDRVGEKRLVAYVVARQEQSPSLRSLRGFLKERLPEYMVPSAFVFLDALPLTANGKVDRQALPAPTSARPESGETFVAPSTPAEEVLAGIWAELLGVEQVGIHDNFFELGGHSLLATQVVSRVREFFRVEIALRQVFETPTVAGLAQSIDLALEKSSGLLAPSIERVPRQDLLPLSYAQQRLWFIHQLDPNSPVYNIPLAVRLTGKLDLAALRATLTEIVHRHEALRTTFAVHDGQPHQLIHPPAELDLPVTDLTNAVEREREVQQIAEAEANLPFDLERGPLLRVRLLQLSEDEQVLLVTMHHIVSDGWSMGVLVKEVAALYTALASGQPSPLAELPIQYADYAVWQREWLRGEVLERQLSYWREQLTGAPAVLELPSDRPRPAVQSFRGSYEPVTVSAELTARLKELSRREGVTLFMLLLGAWQVLLSRYTGAEEITVGTPIANRQRGEVEGLIGYFVNALALRTDLSGDPTFRDLVGRVREVALGAYLHQDVPFEKLVEELQPERALSHSPIFQVVFVLQNAPLGELALSGVNLELLPADNATAKFDLTLNLQESGDVIGGTLGYSTDLFEADTIGRMVAHYLTLLDAIAADVNTPLSQLQLIREAERRQILFEWNATEKEYPVGKCIQELIAEQAARTPEAAAVVDEERELTYRELEQRSNQLARYLQSIGVKPGAHVGISLEHSLETFASILAVLKTGAAYVPLDPGHPPARLAFVIEDAQIGCILTQQSLKDSLPATSGVKLIYVDDETIAAGYEQTPLNAATPEDVAYVIYTSGSTGQPKGVRIQHKALVNYICWSKDVYVQGDQACFALYSSLAFDLTVTSIYTPLLTGGKVFVYRPDEHQSPITRILADQRVDVLKLTPSHLALIKDLDNHQSSIKRLIVGGEALETELARRVYESFGGHVEIFNEYGPTETTVGCMIYRFDAERDQRAYVPIGKPAANVQIYILDDHLNPVPENVSGELYISGAGLAAGCLNREELTQQRFIANPFRPGEKMYRSGDVARRLATGDVEYIGRRDEQVKFHGYRVELNEIRSALNLHAQVRDSVVMLHRDASGNDALVAYYVARQELDPDQLREHLSAHILKETIPNFFVHLKRLPLTLNGKVNHAALPTLEDIKGQSRRPGEYVAPQTEVEEIVAGIWSTLLRVPQVGRYDNFFQLGGHSLLATQVVSRVREALRVELTVRSLFEHPTVNQLSADIETLSRNGLGEIVPPMTRANRERGLAPLSYAQQRLWFIHQLDPGSPAYNIPLAVRLTGRLDLAALRATLIEVVHRHEALRTTFAVRDGEPQQIIHEPAEVELPVTDLTNVAEREQEAQRIAEEEARLPFDLVNGPLLRVRLLQMSEDEQVLLVTMHHIVSDGWSMGVLVKEVAALYTAFVTGEAAQLAELPIQYADYSVWQREWLRGEVLERQLEYWREQLAGAPTVLELPSDRPRPAVQSFRGSFEPVTISAEVTAHVKSLSRREGVTLFMLLLGAWQVLLSRYTGAEEITVGTPIANRQRGEVEGLIGYFVNALALRTNLSGDPTFRELVARVREVALGAYLHQDVPFEKLVEELQPERSLSYNPLFQVVFALENTPDFSLQLPELNISGLDASSGTAKFDLRLGMSEVGKQLMGTLQYSTDLFDAATIQRMLGHFTTLLASIAKDPDTRISELSLRAEEVDHRDTEAQRNQLAVTREGTVRCLHQLFEAQTERTPNAIAISFENERMTYAELNQRADQLAHQLRALGVGPEVLVGLSIERSLELVIGILGILKAGGAYLPLDPSYPRERLQFMIDDAKPAVILTAEGPSATNYTDQSHGSDLDAIRRVDPRNPAYVIYTSGSTGTPKGVVVTHANVVRLFSATRQWFDFNENDVWTLFHSIAFDFSVWELWGALLYGGRLVVVPHFVSRSPEAFHELLSREKVTVLNQTPSAFRQLINADAARDEELSLRLVIFGGEALELQSLKPWFERYGDRRPQLVNMYGITETTVHVTYRPLTITDLNSVRGSRIGGAIPDLDVYVLDRHLQPVPDMVPGELCVGGAGVARGYLNRADLCAERFFPDALSGRRGARLYRSGDLVRRLPGGDIEYLGRIDQQVKLRGFRIELGEIESVLHQHEAVREAVVVLREDAPGEKRLVGYIVPADESAALAMEGLREFLRLKLPDYMVPSAFVLLNEIPLTANGKVDRRNLPAPGQTRPDLRQDYLAPRNELERMLASMWCEILGVEQVGVRDTFFDLGGDSIRGAIFVNHLQERLGEIVHVVVIFTMPTVEQLAQYLKKEYTTAVARLVGENAVHGDENAPRESDVISVATPVTVNETMLAEVRRLIRPSPISAATKNPPVIFILAPPRSGTTLLRVMLAGHPRLFAPPELELLAFHTLAERRAAFTGKDSFWLEGTVRAIMEIKGCDADEAQRIMRSMEERGLTTKECYRQLQSWLGKRILVDKTPSYALDQTILERAEVDFENALYIHLLRHPAGMIRSFEEAKLDQIFFRYEHSWSRRQLAEVIWTLSHQNIVEFLERVPRERQHRVKFEDLLQQPQPVIESLCRFLGINFDADMLQPYKDRERRMTNGIHAESRMLGDVKFHSYDRIDARVGDKWKEGDVANALGETTWEVAAAFGYERDQRKAAPTVESHALQIRPFTASGRTEFPLSFAQERLWFLDQMEQGHSATYNIGTAVRLRGALHVEALRRSLEEILRRHSSLRTSFKLVDGQPVQVIAPPQPFDVDLIDLSELTETEREEQSLKLANEEARLPFDLSRGPLLRARLIRLGEVEHILLVTMHHIVSDGWSMGVLVREVETLYTAFANGQPSPLEELPVQYADYAQWQREWLSGEVLAEHLNYWKRQLQGAPPVLELPTDRPRPAVQSFKGATEPLSISAEVSESLKALSRSEGVTMYMLLLAAWQVLLHRYTGADDIVVGSPMAGRNRAELEQLIGFFVNTLVLRTDLSGNPPFRETLKRVREVTVGAFAHQEVPFEKLVEDLRPERSLSYTPLVQVMFALQNAPAVAAELPELSLSAVDVESGTAKTDLILILFETDQGLRGSLSYDTALFDDSTIRRMLSHFENLLESIVAQPAALIDDLALIPPAEAQRILAQSRSALLPGTAGVSPATHGSDLIMPLQAGRLRSHVQQMFEAQVIQRPNALALLFEDERVTYGELNARANQLAHYLRSLGAGPEVLVGVFFENSVEMIVALLGVLKAGAAYVPLDTKYPAERLGLMFEDTRMPLVITEHRLLEKLPQLEVQAVCLDEEHDLIARQSVENPASVAGPANLAYIIYTSGSTGTPKGVMTEHRNLSEQAAVLAHDFGVHAESRVLQFSSFSFDASIFEIHCALSSGATLCLGRKESLLPGESLLRTFREQEITHVLLPPSALAVMEPDELPQLQTLLAGGEACSADIVRRWSPGRRLLNVYGPTETTVVVTFSECFDAAKPPTIGRAIAGTDIYILDSQLRPAPVGVVGEIYIGGVGVARGYLNRPELTAEKFIPHPFSHGSGARLYRTGDKARLLPNGEIDYQGRLDQQLKLRGFRIEPGEIENALRQHPSIHEALVAAREVLPGDRRLIAYIVKRQESSVSAGELREFLKERLPEYMVPSTFVFLEKIPLTSQGKYDRRALPVPDRSGESRLVAPRDVLELQLTEQWEELLGVPCGVTDDFFELGGHSLLAVRLMSRIEQIFGKKIPLSALFKAPTIESLSTILRYETDGSSWSPLVPIQPHGSARPFFCVHAVSGNVLCYRTLGRHLGAQQPFYALQARGLEDGQEPQTDLASMARDYVAAVRSVQSHGPYLLGGWSVGGLIAFEMARQLQAQGEEVEFLALFDTPAPNTEEEPLDEASSLASFALHLGLSPEQIQAAANAFFEAQTEDPLSFLLEYAKAASIIPHDMSLATFQQQFRVFNANVSAARNYKAANLPANITLFRAAERSPDADPTLGWSGSGFEKVAVHHVPGTHLSMMREPHVSVLAEKLSQCLAARKS